MRYPELRRLKDRLYFTIEDVQDVLGIKPESARVLCTRYTKNGIFTRLKRNFYVLSESWDNFSQEDYLKISNILQVPSYISFMTALSFYEITTQVQRDYFESASVKRSIKFKIKNITFNFYKLKKQYYFDFIKKGDLFIATREKAFLDAVYLYSFGKYKFDLSSLDLEKLDTGKINKILKVYPQKTRDITKRLCGI